MFVYTFVLCLIIASPLMADEIRFDQCECQAQNGFTAVSLAGDNNLEHLVAANVDQTGTFGCGITNNQNELLADSNGFPTSNGAFFDGTADKFFEATIRQDFFSAANVDTLIGARITGGNVESLLQTELIDFGLDVDHILEVRHNRIRFRADVNSDINQDIIGNDFVIAFGVINLNAAQDRTFLCVSADVEVLDFTCAQNEQDIGLFNIAEDAEARILQSSNNGDGRFPLTLRQLLFFKDTGHDPNNIENDVTTFVNANFPDPLVVPALDDDQLTFTIDEDTATDIDLNLALDFANDGLDFTLIEGDLTASGVVGNEANGIFNFNPNLNLNSDSGLLDFQMTYGLASIQCFNQNVDLQLDITPVNDAPDFDVNFLTQTVFAASDTIFENVLVGTDVDNLNGEVLVDGVLNINELPGANAEDGFFVTFDGTNCGANRVDTFTLNNVGQVSFCFRTPVELDGADDQIQVTVELVDGNGNGDGTVATLVLSGDIPIDVGDDVIDVITDENLDNTFTLETLGQERVNTVEFSIIFDSLPTEFGEFNIETGVVLDKNTQVTFSPNDGFFNALDGNGVGQDEEPIDNFGEVVASYRVILDGTDFTTDPQDLQFFVNAEDDGGSVLVLEANDVAVEFIEGSVAGDADLPTVVVTSDNDQSVFDIQLRVTGSGGATILLNANTLDDETLEFINPRDGDNQPTENCVLTPCLSFDLVGTPNQIQFVLNGAIANLDLTQNDPQFILEIKDGNQVLNNLGGQALSFTVTFREELFFEDPANAGAVAGGAGGFLVLIIGFTVYRVRSTSNKRSRQRMTAAELMVQEEIARGKIQEPEQKGAKSHVKGSRRGNEPEVDESGKGEVEPLGNGWEKHYDPESKEYFYHNPSTGKTQWTLPDDLDDGPQTKAAPREGRLNTMDLNL